MLKQIFLFFFSLLFMFSCNKIKRTANVSDEISKTPIIVSIVDSLKSKNQVEAFVRQQDSFLSKFELKKIADFHRIWGEDKDLATKTIANSLGVSESFYKTDLDNNGFTDLLIIGDNHTCSSSIYEGCDFSAILFMNFGNDSIQINRLNKDYGNTSFVPKFESINGKDYLKIFSPNDYDVYDDSTNNYISTLRYKFNGLIEVGQSNDNLNIEQIEFSTGGCFGTCPIFTLKIDKGRNGKFIAEHYNFSQEPNTTNFDKIEGEFHTNIKAKDYQEIISILQYLDFPNLQDGYSVNWTDDQSSTLIITYNNGLTKTIDDYGMVGSYGLILLYNRLRDLRFNQDWKEVPTSH